MSSCESYQAAVNYIALRAIFYVSSAVVWWIKERFWRLIWADTTTMLEQIKNSANPNTLNWDSNIWRPPPVSNKRQIQKDE